VIGELLSNRTNVNVLLSHIAEVLLAETTLRLNSRGYRLGKRNGCVFTQARSKGEIGSVGSDVPFSPLTDQIAEVAPVASPPADKKSLGQKPRLYQS